MSEGETSGWECSTPDVPVVLTDDVTSFACLHLLQLPFVLHSARPCVRSVCWKLDFPDL